MAPPVSYVRNGDVHIAYQTWGDGDVDLVAVPGFVSHLEIHWEQPSIARYLERLGSFARVVMFDRRGTGLSDPITVTRAPTLEARMSDVRAVMDDVGVDSACLLGMSEGVPMSILFAATYPERTRSLVLAGGMARTTYTEDHPWLPTTEDFVAAGVDWILPHWGQGISVDVSYPSRFADEDVRAFFGRLERSAITPGMLGQVAAMFYDTDVRHALPSVQCPTLVLHRVSDRLVNVRSARYVAEHLPGARLVEVAGIDHGPWFERPDEFLEETERFLTGSSTPAETKRRLATVLFSDIVDSTARAVAEGDAAWRELLERHNTTIRTTFERFGGTEVKHTGDGFLATFDGPAAAIRCGAAIHEAVGGLDLRVGLHCGEIEIMGDDIGGIAVHIAKRVSDLAGTGEVLVSRTVKDLVAGSGIAFESRGEHALKGIPDTWEILAAHP